jgi:hypothetical protein
MSATTRSDKKGFSKEASFLVCGRCSTFLQSKLRALVDVSVQFDMVSNVYKCKKSVNR